MNTAFIMKLRFHLLAYADSLWARVMLSKYKCTSFSDARITPGQQASKLWRALVQVKNDISLGIQWSVVKGNNVRFWSDAWAGDLGPLRLLAFCPLSENELNIKVRDMLTSEGNWNWPLFETKISISCLYQIAACKINTGDEDKDVCFWRGTPSGRFTVSSAYSQLAEDDGHYNSTDWRVIWNWKGPEMIKMFLWLCFRDRLLTNVERQQRHLSEYNSCSLCGGEAETVLHVLRDCPTSQNLWNRLINPACIMSFNAGNLQGWISNNLWKRDFVGYSEWGLLFGIVCWACWKRRNGWVFEGTIQDADSVAVYAKGMAVAWTTGAAGMQNAHTAREWRLIGWNRSPVGWIKLNTDGSVKGNDFRASAGGICRDENGNWLVGYARNIDICSIAKAELWGVLDGLTLAWSTGFRRVLVETDSRFVIDAVTKSEVHLNSHYGLISEIKELLVRNWEVKVEHVYREGNMCADRMASYGASLPLGRHVFDNPIPGIVATMLEDLSGVSFPRLGLV